MQHSPSPSKVKSSRHRQIQYLGKISTGKHSAEQIATGDDGASNENKQFPNSGVSNKTLNQDNQQIIKVKIKDIKFSQKYKETSDYQPLPESSRRNQSQEQSIQYLSSSTTRRTPFNRHSDVQNSRIRQ